MTAVEMKKKKKDEVKKLSIDDIHQRLARLETRYDTTIDVLKDIKIDLNNLNKSFSSLNSSSSDGYVRRSELKELKEKVSVHDRYIWIGFGIMITLQIIAFIFSNKQAISSLLGGS